MNTNPAFSRNKLLTYLLALGLIASLVAITAMVIDQSGGNSVARHTREIYQPLGKDADPNLVWSLLYGVFMAGAVCWAVTLFASIRQAGWLRVGVSTAFVVGALTLIYLSVVSEYDSPLLPTRWQIVCGAMAAFGIIPTVVAWLPRSHSAAQ